MPFDEKQRVRDLLRDLVEWSERCARHIDGMSYGQFVTDEKTLDAVSKCVEVIGTAAKSLMEASPELEARHPQLELRRAYATRINLAHRYRGIDPQVLWETATQSIAAISEAARQVLAEYGRNAPDSP